MSIFQCDSCGCAENTALGWYHYRNDPDLTPKEYLGKKLCSACGPTQYPSGDSNEMTGKWHGKFTRTFFPHGECYTNSEGSLAHTATGLKGIELYKTFGRSEEWEND